MGRHPVRLPASSRQCSWKAELRCRIGWLLLVKLMALVLLWNLSFAPAQRVQVVPGLVDARLALPDDALAQPNRKDGDG